MVFGERLSDCPPSTMGSRPPPRGPWAPSPWVSGNSSKGLRGPPWPGEGDVHLWWKELGQGSEEARAGGRFLSGSEGCLSTEEIGRARRFLKAEDARNWVEGRAWIRAVFGAYQECHPSEVAFAFSAEGKPYLTGAGEGVHFNLSHSGTCIVLAVASTAVGVDIEMEASAEMALELEREVFSADELVTLESLEGDRRRQMFYTGWVRKESLVKAIGKGLSVPFPSFRVLGADDMSTQPVPFCVAARDVAGCDASEVEKASNGLSLWDFRIEPEVVGAVAVSHRRPTFYCWSWVE